MFGNAQGGWGVPRCTWLGLTLLFLGCAGFRLEAANPPGTLSASEQLLIQGHVDESIASLHTLLQANTASGPAHLLLCRAYLSEEVADQAVSECEAAISTMANDSA